LLAIVGPRNLAFYRNEDRKFTLNLVNAIRAINQGNDHRKTLELRWPEGTLDARSIRSWVKMFLCFIETCKKRDMPDNLECLGLQEVLECFGLGDEPAKRLVLSHTLNDAKAWFLERIIGNAADSKKTYKASAVKTVLQEAEKTLFAKSRKTS
jgi:hypothetical protein